MEDIKKEVQIINDERYRDIKKLLIERGIQLDERNFILYGNMFEILARFINNKMDNKTMIDVYDLLTDIIQNKVPRIAVHVSVDDKIKFLVRYMKTDNRTNHLSLEEMNKFAFICWFTIFVMFGTDDSDDILNGLSECTTYENIEKEYNYYYTTRPYFFASEEEDRSNEDGFAFTMENPICVQSMGLEEMWLNRLEYDGKPITYYRIGSVSRRNGHILDKYEITAHKLLSTQKFIMYVDVYSTIESKNPPKGFTFKK